MAHFLFPACTAQSRAAPMEPAELNCQCTSNEKKNLNTHCIKDQDRQGPEGQDQDRQVSSTFRPTATNVVCLYTVWPKTASITCLGRLSGQEANLGLSKLQGAGFDKSTEAPVSSIAILGGWESSSHGPGPFVSVSEPPQSLLWTGSHSFSKRKFLLLPDQNINIVPQ